MPSLKYVAASFAAAVSTAASTSSRRARDRKPLPPPPADALIANGSRHDRAARSASERRDRLDTAGNDRHSRFLHGEPSAILSPISSMASACGPIESTRPPPRRARIRHFQRESRNQDERRARPHASELEKPGRRDSSATARPDQADTPRRPDVREARRDRRRNTPRPRRYRSRGRASDAHRDVAAIGDENLVEHAFRRASISSNSRSGRRAAGIQPDAGSVAGSAVRLARTIAAAMAASSSSLGSARLTKRSPAGRGPSYDNRRRRSGCRQ